nr:MAG TPA: hypothetical protein [Bacteriophage sp.]
MNKIKISIDFFSIIKYYSSITIIKQRSEYERIRRKIKRSNY